MSEPICICITTFQGIQNNTNCRVHRDLANYSMTPFPLSPPILADQSDMEKLQAKLDKIISLLERGVK